MTKSILIVEDDKMISTIIAKKLEAKGYNVYQVFKGDAVERMVIRHMPDCIILDIGLPNISGYDVFRILIRFYNGPIIFLTGQQSEDAEITSLQLGADDFVHKTKHFDILYQRIKRLLESENDHSKEVTEINIGSFKFDKKSYHCTFNENKISLTNDEFELLFYLLIHKDKLSTRDTLYLDLKGFPYDGISRGIDVNISRLKEKLSVAGLSKDTIISVRGKGYMLDSTKLTQILSMEEKEYIAGL